MSKIVRLFLALAVTAGLCSSATAQYERKSVFSHRYHIDEEELSCADCHGEANASDSANDDLNPVPTVCLDCHDPGTVNTTWAPKTREYIFSHNYHLDALDLTCTDCHASVQHMDNAKESGLPIMADCMTCHNDVAAPRACAACHTSPQAALVPATHAPGWEREHGLQARITDTSCLPCHSVDQCQQCHEGALLAEWDNGVVQNTFAPELQGDAGLVVKRVHHLNYRFLHALEARGKSSYCATCHEVDSGDFCADCHNPAMNADIRPVWHGGADWGALAGGVGSGGGRHAELARRDLENCAACHGIQSDDPTCLTCHMDGTRGKGNDPSTHARSFVGDIGNGDFHDDEDATCFVCHTYKGPIGGDGFCGYCHGGK